MQKEIESLAVAMFAEQKRETELICDILKAIARSGLARRQMLQDIAAAIAQDDFSIQAGQGSVDRAVEDGLAGLNQAINLLRAKVG